MSNIELPIFKVPILSMRFLGTLERERSAYGIQPRHFLVEAKNKKQARLSLAREPSFWRNYNNASVEERRQLIHKEFQPFKLSREGKIERILDCELRYKNNNEEYVCGRPLYDLDPTERGESFPGDDETCGEFGFCCIDGGYDPSHVDCPYLKDYEY